MGKAWNIALEVLVVSNCVLLARTAKGLTSA